MKKFMVFISVFMVVCLTSAQGAKSEYMKPDTSDLVPTELVNEAGWTRNWQINLPLKPTEKIELLNVMGPYLFTMTDTNVLFCINREKGRVQASSQLSTSQMPVSKPFFYEGNFWFIVGNELIVFDPTLGDFTIKKKFPRVGSTAEYGLARNKNYIYICGSDKRLHAINADGYWQQFIATADNDSPIVSVVATEDIVVFATQAGNIVGMSPNEAEKIWQYDVTGQIKGHLVLDGNDIYIGSLDSKLYKIGLSDGKLVWNSPYHSGARIQDAVVVGTEVVYLHNPLNGLNSVDKQSGQFVWQVVSGEGVICETPQKGFIFASPGILKVMDNKKGKELYSMNFSSVQRYATNTIDPVMYLADTKGRIMSITVK